MRADRLLRRVAAMPAAEIRDRLASTMRREAARLAHRARPARTWRRDDLAGALVPRTAELAAAITHLSAGRVDDAHHALARHFATRPRRWPIAPAMRDPVARTLRTRFPDAAVDAVRRADAIADGRFDVLGYRDLRFIPTTPESSAQDSGVVTRRLRSRRQSTGIAIPSTNASRRPSSGARCRISIRPAAITRSSGS